MTRTHKTWRLAILIAAFSSIAMLAGCEQTKISSINKHPENFAGSEVTIAGKVTSTATSTNPGMFEVDDGSGRLWVLSTSNEVPAEGTKLAVTGLVETKNNLGSATLVTALQEIKRYGGD